MDWSCMAFRPQQRKHGCLQRDGGGAGDPKTCRGQATPFRGRAGFVRGCSSPVPDVPRVDVATEAHSGRNGDRCVVHGAGTAVPPSPASAPAPPSSAAGDPSVSDAASPPPPPPSAPPGEMDARRRGRAPPPEREGPAREAERGPADAKTRTMARRATFLDGVARVRKQILGEERGIRGARWSLAPADPSLDSDESTAEPGVFFRAKSPPGSPDGSGEELMAEVVANQVVVKGVRSLVRESGARGSREAVVFVHGNPGSSEDWTDLVGRVGAFGRAVALTLVRRRIGRRASTTRSRVTGVTCRGSSRSSRLTARTSSSTTSRRAVLGGFEPGRAITSGQGGMASLTLVNMGVLPGYTWHKAARIWRTPILGELFDAHRDPSRLSVHAIAQRGAATPKPRSRAAFVDRMYRRHGLPGTEARSSSSIARRPTRSQRRALRRAELSPLHLPDALSCGGPAIKFLSSRWPRYAQKRSITSATSRFTSSTAAATGRSSTSRSAPRSCIVPFTERSASGWMRPA